MFAFSILLSPLPSNQYMHIPAGYLSQATSIIMFSGSLNRLSPKVRTIVTTTIPATAHNTGRSPASFSLSPKKRKRNTAQR